MATVVTCDGCGTMIDPEATQYGFVRKTQYCEPCEESVVAYLDERDGLHTDLARQWEIGLADAKKRWQDAHKDGRLPDYA